MNLREAAELAIEALQSARSVFNGEGDTIGGCGWCHAPSYGPCEPHCEKDRAVKALRAALSNTQDWDEVEALRASLREHMSEIHRLRAAGRQAFDELKECKRSDDDRVSIAMHILNAALAENSWLDEQLDTLFEEIDKGEFKAAQNRIDELSNTEKYGYIHIPDLSEAQALIGRYSRFEQADKSMQRLTDVQQEMESVTDCHDLKKARATVIENLLAHFGITSANSDVNLAYLHKQLDNFLAASISCNKDGDKLTLPLKEVEECSYPNCLSTNGCEKQCPAFPRLKDSHIGDANKMVATSQESRQVEPVAYSYTDARGRTVLVSTNTAPYEDAKPLYTAPPKREPLTEEQIEFRFGKKPTRYMMFLIRSTERAHGIGGEE